MNKTFLNWFLIVVCSPFLILPFILFNIGVISYEHIEQFGFHIIYNLSQSFIGESYIFLVLTSLFIPPFSVFSLIAGVFYLTLGILVLKKDNQTIQRGLKIAFFTILPILAIIIVIFPILFLF